MITEPAGRTEIAILGRILGNEDGQIPPELARYILDRQLSPRDQSRMHELLLRNQDDDLSPDEHAEAIALGKAASLLAILKSKARVALGVTLESDRQG